MSVRLHHILIVACLFAPRATAHDLWLVPPEKVEIGKPSTVRAISGTRFPKGDRAPDPAKFARRVVILPDGTEGKLEATGTQDDAGLLRFDAATSGVYAIAVETTPKILAMEAAAFNKYLVSDGLPHVFLLRAEEGTLDKTARERYSKSPKTLVRVGDGKAGEATKPIGLPLEIIPMADPFARKPGDALKVRVLFRGKPLAGANLGWDHPGGDELPAGTARTDDKGVALIPVARAGLMTIRLTHMTRPKAADYEWESFWTSLTFRLPE